MERERERESEREGERVVRISFHCEAFFLAAVVWLPIIIRPSLLKSSL